MRNSPIIFLHKGNPSFLEVVLNRVRLQNEGSEVILLGDKYNSHIQGVTHHFIDDYSFGAIDFEENYYIHMSKNPYHFELICYQRWFVIAEFIKGRYDSFWYFDSDVIVYGNLNDYINGIPNNDTYDLIGHDIRKSKERSFMPAFNFYTSQTINKITEYLLRSYVDIEILKKLKAKWRVHLTENKPGGVCDMTQLALFFLDNSLNIFNSYDMSNDIIVDGNINSKDNFNNSIGTEFKMLIGAIKYTQVVDYHAFVHLHNGTAKKLIATHFQGGESKRLIKSYSKRHFNPKTIIPYLIIYKIRDSLVSTAKKTIKRVLGYNS